MKLIKYDSLYKFLHNTSLYMCYAMLDMVQLAAKLSYLVQIQYITLVDSIMMADYGNPVRAVLLPVVELEYCYISFYHIMYNSILSVEGIT